MPPGQSNARVRRVASNPVTDRSELVRPLLRTRQIREFTHEPVDEADLAALADVARWSAAAGKARLPRAEVVFNERWPEGSI